MIRILRRAADEGLPLEIGEETDVWTLGIYRELIDSGDLVGTALSDGDRPYFIGSARITAEGRIRLKALQAEVDAERPYLLRHPKILLAGWLLGLLTAAAVWGIAAR